MDQSDRASRCPRCGATLSTDAHEGLCPACLLAAGSEPLSHASGEQSTMLPSSGEKGVRPLFSGGERFGPYLIERLLGRGGMGDVYEAEQVEQGRRVAIKVLSQRLNDPQDRARFLREGQLAASISHPHSVYIFGSEEITGVPVIAMELLPGGTLKDRVARGGPMRPAEAVDAILQVIAGLDAAQAAGILHRDIKPSNCFVDSAGDVKVGDFGLSISTLARDMSQLTIRGTFHGTPQFAAPEQLRGEPLDVRADIYSVGATVFYLLTGRPPFDDRDLMTLLARIATEPPPSPRALAPLIPRALAAVVVRCLAKDRAQRPASYAALDDALRPFGSAAPTPATLGLRFLAAVVDATILSLPSLPLMFSWSANLYAPRTLAWISGINVVAQLSYFGILEGLWGAAIGKWICGLRVVRPDGNRPGVARAVARALIFEIPGLAGGALTLWLGSVRMFQIAAHPGGSWLTALPYYGGLCALFSTMRRRNGFAGLHDLATGTRVVQRPRRNETRVAIDLGQAAPVAGPTARHIGPFDLIGELGATDRGRLLLGFDRSLRRSVWIHVLPSGTPALAPRLRDLSRPGRLRWLNGQRSPEDAWDAYEALDGAPLVAPIHESRPRQPWRTVRFWLLDLAREIDAGLRDGSLAALALDRVWIARDGRAKLLDFTPPGAVAGAAPEPVPTFVAAQTFLRDLAERALDRSTPLPLSADMLLSRLANGAFTNPGELISQMAGLANRPDRIGPLRRAVPMALSVAPAVFMLLMTVAVMPLIRNLIPKDAMELSLCLSELKSIPQNATGEQARRRETLETYVAGRFGPLLAAPSDTQPPNPILAGLLGPHLAEIDHIRAAYPHVSPEQTARASAELEETLKRFRQVEDAEKTTDASSTFFASLFFFALTAVCGVVSSWVFRGGWLMRALGIAVVVPGGREASRIRTLVRGIIAWWPVPVLFYIFSSTLMFASSWTDARTHPLALVLAFVPSVLFSVGAVYAVLNPERGWQDRLAGTWLVPR
jgi:serine/threonine protein kinase